MEEVCDLPKGEPNYAWCFDCVPEENSLLLGFGDARVEVPAIDLVFEQPRELLGQAGAMAASAQNFLFASIFWTPWAVGTCRFRCIR